MYMYFKLLGGLDTEIMTWGAWLISWIKKVRTFLTLVRLLISAERSLSDNEWNLWLSISALSLACRGSWEVSAPILQQVVSIASSPVQTLSHHWWGWGGERERERDRERERERGRKRRGHRWNEGSRTAELDKNNNRGGGKKWKNILKCTGKYRDNNKAKIQKVRVRIEVNGSVWRSKSTISLSKKYDSLQYDTRKVYSKGKNHVN